MERKYADSMVKYCFLLQRSVNKVMQTIFRGPIINDLLEKLSTPYVEFTLLIEWLPSLDKLKLKKKTFILWLNSLFYPSVCIKKNRKSRNFLRIFFSEHYDFSLNKRNFDKDYQGKYSRKIIKEKPQPDFTFVTHLSLLYGPELHRN